MALSRISDLIVGTAPVPALSLFEVSVPNAGAPSGYDSRKFNYTNIFTNIPVSPSIGYNRPADDANRGLYTKDVCLNDSVVAFNGYYGTGGGSGWKRLNTLGVGGFWIDNANGYLNYGSASAGAAGTAITFSPVMTVSPSGSVYTTGPMGIGGYQVAADNLAPSSFYANNVYIAGSLGINTYYGSGSNWKRMNTNPVGVLVVDGAGSLVYMYGAGGTSGTAVTVTTLFKVSSGGSLVLTGSSINFMNSSGPINGVGGPLIFADTNTIVLKCGNGIAGVAFQSYNGANFLTVSQAGALQIAQGLYVRNNTTPTLDMYATHWLNIYALDGVDNKSCIMLGDAAVSSNIVYAGQGHFFRNVDQTYDYLTMDGAVITIRRQTTFSSGDYGIVLASAPSTFCRIRYNNTNVRVWSAGAADNGTWGVFDESAALLRHKIDTNGTQTIYGSGDPLVMLVPNGNYCRIMGTVLGTRTWTFGPMFDGTWGIADESAGSVRLLINTAGNLIPQFNIYPSGNNFAQIGANGNAWSNVWSYAYPGASDPRDKEDIEAFPSGALAKLKALNPVTFRWKKFPKRGKNYGFLAPDVRDVMGPDFAGYRKAQGRDGREAIEHNQLLAVLWQAVRELADELAELKGKMA